MDTTISAPAAASAGVAHQVAPRSTRGMALCLVRFVTLIWKPASRRWRHMWAPMMPVPTQPIVAMLSCTTVLECNLGGHQGVETAGSERARGGHAHPWAGVYYSGKASPLS